MEDVDFAVDDAALRDFLPMSFGKQSRVANVQAQIDQSKRKILDTRDDKEETGVKAVVKAQDNAAKVNGAEGGNGVRGKGKVEEYGNEEEDVEEEEEEEEEDDDDDDDDDDDEFPVSHELVVKTHDRTVTTATLDYSGARLITGSTDCTLKLHDFASMTPTTVRAFKSVDPTASKYSTNVETHPVHQALFNPLAPSLVLVVTALPQAKIISRDGDPIAECVKGDMYLRDMHNTKGHVSEVTSGKWHPTQRDRFVTVGTDSTLRIWDVNNTRAQKEVIVHKSRAAGSSGRTRVTAVAWGSPRQGGDNVLVAVGLDGTLVMWAGEGPYVRPAAEIRDAHTPGTWTGGIDISADGRLVVTRGGDDTVKLWDTRKFKTPVSTAAHPSTSSQYPASNICFSPAGTNVITGSATGHLHILNPATLRPELVTPVTPNSPLVTVLWHEKLNQIVTGSANAESHVLYNPTLSTGGAKLVMSKAPKRRHIDDDPNLTMDLSHGISGDSIIVPGANGNRNKNNVGNASTTSSSGNAGMLPPSNTNSNPATFSARHPTIGLTASGRSRDPRRPHLPQQTPFAKSQPDERHIRESIPLSSMRNEDPREALLKYADKAQKDPLFTNAWAKTQPETIYGEVSDEEEDDDGKGKGRKGTAKGPETDGGAGDDAGDEEGGPERKKIKM